MYNHLLLSTVVCSHVCFWILILFYTPLCLSFLLSSLFTLILRLTRSPRSLTHSLSRFLANFARDQEARGAITWSTCFPRELFRKNAVLKGPIHYTFLARYCPPSSMPRNLSVVHTRAGVHMCTVCTICVWYVCVCVSVCVCMCVYPVRVPVYMWFSLTARYRRD